MDLQNNEIKTLYEKSFQAVEEGSIIKGKVVAKMPDSIVVDIGYKSEGFIPIDEFDEQEREEIQLGDGLEVYVTQLRDNDGLISLSRERAQKIKAFQELQETFKDEKAIKGKIIERVKGGFFVDILGIKAFMPGSQTDIKPVKNMDQLIGTESLFKILKLNTKLTNVVVSRRLVLEVEREKLRSETIKHIKEGATMKGTVKNITDYGVFIDLGGIDGLLHISDISWGRISHPSEFFAIGDTIDVIILQYDIESQKVTLGYKQQKSDPWLHADEKYPVGKKITGKVVSLTDYGAFIEVEEGVEGLVHVSELDWSPRPRHPSKYLEIGDVIETEVLKVDKDNRRLSLSLRKLRAKPWDLVSQRYSVGQKVIGKIRTLTDFGAFMGLPEGVDALIHISDLSWTRHIKHPSEILKKGQKLEAVVLNIEPEKEKMALGLKQLQEDPWTKEIPERYHLGDEISCSILRITDFGIFALINNDVEGLIYSSEIAPSKEDTSDSTFKEGDTIKARIIKLEPDERKIGLSMKNLSPQPVNAEKTEETAE